MKNIIIKEENSKLKSHIFQIPEELYANLLSLYNKVKDNPEYTNIDGYKRLSNIINRKGEITYEWIKRIKNFWDYYSGDYSDMTAQLNGGKDMQKWVNKALDDAEASIKNDKQISKNAGLNNTFISTHYKDNTKITIDPKSVSMGGKIREDKKFIITPKQKKLIEQYEKNKLNEKIGINWYDNNIELEVSYINEEFEKYKLLKENYNKSLIGYKNINEDREYIKKLFEKQGISMYNFDKEIDNIIKYIDWFIHMDNVSNKEHIGKIPKNVLPKFEWVKNININFIIYETYSDTDLWNKSETSTYNSINYNKLIDNKLEEININLIGYSLKKQLIRDTMTPYLYHELNHAYQNYKMLIKDENYGVYQQNLKNKYDVANFEMDNSNSKPIVTMSQVIYWLFSPSERNAHIEELYGELKNLKSISFKNDFHNTKIYQEYELMKNENIPYLNTLKEEYWNIFNKRFLNYPNNTTNKQIKNKFNKQCKFYLNDILHKMGKVVSFYYEKLNMVETKHMFPSNSNLLSKKYIISEKQYKLIENHIKENDSLNEMAYPTTFDMGKFKLLKSFNQRFQYCKQKLEYISSGSSRYVFGIDTEKVLKLAKNQKGVIQNEHEYDMANDYATSIVAEVFDCDKNYLWIEMERVNKITSIEFKRITGLDFKDFVLNIEYYSTQTGQNQRRITQPYNYQEIWENEFFKDIADLVASFGLSYGDLIKLSSYGITKNGDIKLIDAGLNNDIYNTYYNSKKFNEQTDFSLENNNDNLTDVESYFPLKPDYVRLYHGTSTFEKLESIMKNGLDPQYGIHSSASGANIRGIWTTPDETIRYPFQLFFDKPVEWINDKNNVDKLNNSEWLVKVPISPEEIYVLSLPGKTTMDWVMWDKNKENNHLFNSYKGGIINYNATWHPEIKKVIINENIQTEVDAEQINLKSFEQKSNLNPKLFPDDKNLNKCVRLKLLEIADDFVDFLDLPFIEPKDIILVGSSVGYQWSKYSDIDLHIIYDFNEISKEKEFVRNYFDSKKNEWNNNHKGLKIYGMDVELYVENLREPSVSNGRYSLETNQWLQFPNKENNLEFDKEYVKEKSAKFMTLIDDMYDIFENNKDSYVLSNLVIEVNKLWSKIKKMRKKGIEKSGEMSIFNIIFKVLRRSLHLEKLYKLKQNLYVYQNSIR